MGYHNQSGWKILADIAGTGFLHALLMSCCSIAVVNELRIYDIYTEFPELRSLTELLRSENTQAQPRIENRIEG